LDCRDLPPKTVIVGMIVGRNVDRFKVSAEILGITSYRLQLENTRLEQLHKSEPLNIAAVMELL